MIMSWVLRAFFLLLITQFGLGANIAKDIFLLGGEANMAGQGGVIHAHWDGYKPPEVRTNSKILRLNPVNRWEVATEPLNAGIDNGPWGVGPGIAFAHEVLAKNGSKFGVVGLVPCAYSNTRMAAWTRGTFFYTRLISRAKVSLQEGGTIRALLWYQGESDTMFQSDADTYKENTHKFFQNLRSDLNLPSLLIIQVAIASGEGYFTEKIREDQLSIELPNVNVVDAKGLPLEREIGSPPLHLTTDSEVKLGQNLAHVFLASQGHLSGEHVSRILP